VRCPRACCDRSPAAAADRSVSPVSTAPSPAAQAWAHNALAAGMGVAQWRALGCAAHLVVTEPRALDAARAAVDGEVGRMDLAASRFRDDSALTRLNEARGAWVEVGPALAEALAVACGAAEWTDGLVDPTVGESLVLLGYDRTFDLVEDDAPALRVAVSPAVGWRCIELDGTRARVPAGVRVDLGATAKGLASDRAAAAALAATGVGVMVSLGGDVAVTGPAPIDGWPIHVSDHSEGPREDLPGGAGQVVRVRQGGLATSGTTARRWRRGGSAFHHIIDPRSGMPTTGPWRTVSVAAATCVDANAAATAAIIRGEGADRWIDDHGLAARLVRHDGTTVHCGGWPGEVTT
jgi:thiamine biosynthesis lipoprotein ApbE